MQQIGNLLANYKLPEKPLKKTGGGKRAGIVEQFVIELNKEREGTKYPPVTGQYIGIKLSVIKGEDELWRFYAECQDYKRSTGKTFSQRFWGGFKKQEWKKR